MPHDRVLLCMYNWADGSTYYSIWRLDFPFHFFCPKFQQLPPPFLPTLAFMTLMFDLFVPLFSRCMETASAQITPTDWTQLTEIFRLGFLAPIYVTYLYPQSNVTLVPLLDDGTLSPLQESMLRDLDFLLKVSLMSTTYLTDLLYFVIRKWHYWLPRTKHKFLYPHIRSDVKIML